MNRTCFLFYFLSIIPILSLATSCPVLFGNLPSAALLSPVATIPAGSSLTFFLLPANVQTSQLAVPTGANYSMISLFVYVSPQSNFDSNVTDVRFALYQGADQFPGSPITATRRANQQIGPLLRGNLFFGTPIAAGQPLWLGVEVQGIGSLELLFSSAPLVAPSYSCPSSSFPPTLATSLDMIMENCSLTTFFSQENLQLWSGFILSVDPCPCTLPAPLNAIACIYLRAVTRWQVLESLAATNLSILANQSGVFSSGNLTLDGVITFSDSSASGIPLSIPSSCAIVSPGTDLSLVLSSTTEASSSSVEIPLIEATCIEGSFDQISIVVPSSRPSCWKTQGRQIISSVGLSVLVTQSCCSDEKSLPKWGIALITLGSLIGVIGVIVAGLALFKYCGGYQMRLFNSTDDAQSMKIVI